MLRALVTTILAIVVVCVVLLAGAEAHPAWGIAVDRHGQVYFSDLINVWKIDAQGKVSVFRAGRDHTHELNLDEAGNVYGAENSYDPATNRFFAAIWKMTPAGSFSYLLPATENPPLGISIWKDREGNTYHVGNYRERELVVFKRTPNGNVTGLVGSSDAVREYRQKSPYSVGAIAFGPDGALYFTHGSNVSKVTMSGALTALARNVVVNNTSGKPADESRLLGIAVDAHGNAFVADYGNRRIVKIAPDDQLTTLIRGEASWFPTGVAEKGGDLYILEESHTPTYQPIGTRVRKLSRDGKVVVLGTVGENIGSSGSSAPGESSSSPSPENIAKPRQNFPYALIGAGMGIFALTIIVWGIQRRMYERQQGKS